MKIICIAGKARHGKDTAATKLEQVLTDKGYRVLIAHYGDLVKYVCKTFFGWNGKKDEEGRRILQYVGTDVVRNKMPDYWVDFIISILKLFNGEWDYVLIPDCRFPNEIDKMKEAGFEVKTMRIIRDNFETDLTEEQQNHISETALDEYKFDGYILNASTIDVFHEMVENYANYLMED